jgi:DNA-binding NarL/FixJ family response regulator
MDVDMPTMNGVEATRRIKGRQPGVVIVGLSLHDEEGVARAMLEAGADAYISKNSPGKDVVEAVRRACRRQEADAC